MKKLLIATTNRGKLKEFTKFFSDLPLKTISLKEVGITDDVEETGTSYEENSQLKALFYAKKSGLPAIADDGGLEIAALGGAPGVKSRRWIGEDATEEDLVLHMKKVARELSDNNRNASFRLALSFALPDGSVWTEYGEVEGVIAKEPLMRTLKGYPFRSFFYLLQIKKYYHEDQLTPEEEKLYNHRRKAVEKLKPIIKGALNI